MDQASLAGLTVSRSLADFVDDEALPGTGVTAERFWRGLAGIVADLAPRNRALLAERDELQAQDRRLAPRAHAASRSTPPPTRRSCARSATCCRRPPTSRSTTANVDAEIAAHRRAAARRAGDATRAMR